MADTKERADALEPTCSIADCGRSARKRGWCIAHDRRWQRHGNPLAGGPFRSKHGPVCSISGCHKAARMRGWCSMHHQRFLRHGDPLIAGHLVITGSVEDRLWGRVDKSGPVPAHRPELGPCWVRSGSTAGEGYSSIRVDGQDLYAHRLVYEWLVGPIPEGYEVDHLCSVRRCVRPEHLEAVTGRENRRRAAARARERKKLGTIGFSRDAHEAVKLLPTPRR